jgi:xanthine dehydrogenase YagS FAD-binding subunit
VELLQPSSAEEAVAALGDGAVAIAGGADVVPLLYHRLLSPSALVDVRQAVPKGVRDGSIVGAGTVLAELEVDPLIPDALREACRVSASPQLRAMSTLAGNLLQATRCWYWRLEYPCFLHGGDRCHAREGEHREHAILGNERCASAHPSDIAAALVALDARLRTTRRELPVAELYRLPTEDDRSTTTLAPDELILEVELPPTEASVYLKATDRKAWSFPLVGVAAARGAGGTRFGLAGVAPIPWPLGSVDELDAATPLPGTAYKLQIARALVRRADAALRAL